MKKIMLFCSQGMSTSALIKKMKEAAEKLHYECEISAHTVYEIMTLGKKADCVLLGPQVRYQLEKAKKELIGIPVDCIEMRSYAIGDGEAILKQAKKMMGD